MRGEKRHGLKVRNRQSRAATILLVVGMLLLAACGRGSDKVPYPHESVLTVVMELKLFVAQDPYRRVPGADLEGSNIFRVSLKRLDALGGLAGPEYGDVLAFARGECLERLGQWPEAVAAFDEATSSQTKLAPVARERAAAVRRMAQMVDRGAFEPTLEGYLNDLEVLERRLGDWIEEKPAFPYESLARVERERAQEERLRLLMQNRLVLKDGVTRAVAAAGRLVEQNDQSWRVNLDRLLQGELYETLARDFTAVNRPETIDFKVEGPWSAWVERAREAYRQVAQADGDPAKPEGQARLRVLDTYAMRVRSLAR